MKNVISIQLNTIEEALHMQNVATLNIGKYQANPIDGQSNLQSALVRMWRDIHQQAGKVVVELSREVEKNECNM